MTTHINLNWTSNSLCGEKINYNSAWLTKVFEFISIYPKTTWCEKCKLIYNITHVNKLIE